MARGELLNMKYYKNSNNTVFAYAADGSQDHVIKSGLIAITSEQAEAITNPALTLADLKARHVEIMKTSCVAAITAGIDHDALGDLHHYPIQPTDQINMAGLVARSQLLGAVAEPYKFWCADGAGIWARRGHTVSQIEAVGLAFSAHVIACQDKYESKLIEINNAAQPTDLDAITW
jgi:hypothetical protein